MSEKHTGIGAAPQAHDVGEIPEIGDRHARLRLHGEGPLERLPQARVHGLAAAAAAAARLDRGPQRGRGRRGARERYGYERWTTDWRDIVADPAIGLFDNGGPNSLHAEPTIAAAEAGKHVLCEKPLGRDADESYEIWQRVAATGVKHLCAFNYRFVPAVRLAREMIEAGELGEIRHFRGRYLQDWGDDPTLDTWRFHADEAGSGAIGDLGAHVIDLARYLVGEIATGLGARQDVHPGPPGRRRARGRGRVRARRGRHARGDAARARAPERVPVGDQRLEGLARVRHGAPERAPGLPGRRRPGARLQDGARLRGRPSVLELLVAAGAHHRLGRDLRPRDPPPARARSRDDTDVAPHGATFEDGYRAAEVCDAIVRSSDGGQPRDAHATATLERIVATPDRRIPTGIVGSYAQPDWLIDRERLRDRFPPRVRAMELWRVDPAYLEQAQDDATLLAIRDQELAGIDILTDGEMRRESYSNRFATALSGVDIDNPGTALDRSGHPNPVPRVVGPIERMHPVQVRDVQFLRANTSKRIKVTVPGPFTMSQQAQNDYFDSDAECALAYAGAVHDEIVDLFAAGADIVQIDEPYMQARPEKAREFGLAALERALDGVVGTTAVHICFGYAAIIHERPSGLLVPLRDGGLLVRPDLDRDRPVGSRHVDPRDAAGQADHPRRHQPRRPCGRVARDRRRPDPQGASVQAAERSSSPRRTAG